jgi:hypothetical protein
MYLETSGDILNIVLAFAILWIAVVLTIVLWQVGSVAVGIRRIVRSGEEKLAAIDDMLGVVREKLASTSTALAMLVEIAREGVTWFRAREERPGFTRKTKRRA